MRRPRGYAARSSPVAGKGTNMSFLLFIQEHLRTGFGDLVFPIITRLGDAGFIWILIGLVLLCHPKTRCCGWTVLISILLAYVTGELLIKNIVQRPRPFTVENVELLIAAPSGFSFPSGHSGSSFAAAVSLFLYRRKLGSAAIVLAALIAFSRMYLFVHYPTDVLCGSLLGFASALLVSHLMRRREARI